ncbi:MAG: hypothetical protein QXD13_01630 [Candidatus Pacearchaeota archaeon]
MAVDPKKLVAAINPGVYCLELKEKYGEILKVRKEVQNALKESLKKGEKDAYLKAAKDAELVEPKWMDFDEVVKTPFALEGLKNPIEQHTISYETTGGSIEKVYFWLHDYIVNNKSEYGDAKKLVDSFVSSPGSGHFAEMSARATRMQEEAMKILGVINQMIKSILNITYDLKEFQLRLDPYNNLKSKDENIRSAAMFSLKQIWLDTVDIKKGNSSIKAMAVGGVNAPNFVMLIDAFMVAESLEKIDKMDLNDRIKRILKQRFAEFQKWLVESEKELRRRFELEKTYLKSQYNSIQLYARWAKPYLEAARMLEQRATASAALVTAFETSLFELTLLGIGEYNIRRDIAVGDLPKMFEKKVKRKYSPVVLVELKFRSIPERSQKGGYGFIGKAEITFTSFALNEDEIKVLEDQLNKDIFGDVIDLIGGTTESLAQLKEDVDKFLSEEPSEEEKEEKKEVIDTNPFSALWSIFFPSKSKEEKKANLLEIRPDDALEKVVRSQAAIEARRKCRKFYDAFKKAYNIPTL